MFTDGNVHLAGIRLLPFSRLLVTLINNVILLSASLTMMPFSVKDFMPVFIYVHILYINIYEIHMKFFMYFLQGYDFIS